MPSPFSWDITKPAGADALSIGDDQIRTDKTTIRDVLRTLVPYGTPTTGWRVVQIDNNVYIVHNAKYDGTSWSHDDTSLAAQGIRIGAGAIDFLRREAAASTWLTAAWILIYFVNAQGLIPDAANTRDLGNASNPIRDLYIQGAITAAGAGADIDAVLKPKGAGIAKAQVQAVSYNVPVILDRDVTITTVNNTAVETTVYSFSILQNVLRAGRALRLILVGEVLTNDNATTDHTIRAKLGATTFGAIKIDNSPLSATRRMFKMVAEVHAITLTSQVGYLQGRWSNQVGVAGGVDDGVTPGDSGSDRLSGHTAMALDNGVGALTLVVTSQFDAAGGVNTEFVMRTAVLELLL